MNKYFCTTLLLLLVGFTSLRAQQVRPAVSLDTLAAREAHVLSIKLRLSREQKVKVYHLTRKNMVQMDSVRKLPLEAGAKTSSLTTLAKDYRAALKGVFTAEQYTGYEALVNEHRKKFEARNKNVRALPVN